MRHWTVPERGTDNDVGPRLRVTHGVLGWAVRGEGRNDNVGPSVRDEAVSLRERCPHFGRVVPGARQRQVCKLHWSVSLGEQ